MGAERYKYAIVRIPETSVIDFFSTIVAKGYSDVSFVSTLSQCTLRDDPNEDPMSTSYKDSLDDDSTSENIKSSPSTMHSAAAAPPPQRAVKEEQFDVTSSSANSTPADLITPTTPAEFICNLFGKDFDMSEWNYDSSQGVNDESFQIDKKCNFHPYKNTRMKGWQREYIKDVINNGHYPTEEELRDIEQKCDLSRKQVLRFIAKRLVNPNRKPRVNHLEEKAKEAEEKAHLDNLIAKPQPMFHNNDTNNLLSSPQPPKLIANEPA